MFTSSLRAAGWAAALVPLVAAAAPLSLDAALDLAARHSEAVLAARAGVASATEAADAAGRWPDPVLRVGVENLPATGADRFRTTPDSMTMKRIGISQEWLSSDKRAAREAAAAAALARESAQTVAAVAEARLQTSLAFVDLWYAGEALRLGELASHHAHEELDASRARLASSAGSAQEVLLLTGMRGLAEDESAEARQQWEAARLALRRWTGVDADAPVLAMPTSTVPAEPAYLAAHPQLAAMRQDIEVARRAAAVTAGERRPNWTWEVSYGQRTGYSDMVSVGVSIPLAVAPDRRQDRDTASRLALVDKAEADLAEATRAAMAEYRTLDSDAQRLQQRVDRYAAAVLAPAAQRTAAVLAAYRSNQASLALLFEARHAEVDLQRRLLSLQRELAKTRMRLAFKPLDAGAVR